MNNVYGQDPYAAQQMLVKQMTAQQVLSGVAGGSPRPVAPILSSLGARNGEVNSLHEALGELERRLSGVLRPAGPSDNDATYTAPTAMMSAVAEEIARLGSGVSSARDRHRRDSRSTRGLTTGSICIL